MKSKSRFRKSPSLTIERFGELCYYDPTSPVESTTIGFLAIHEAILRYMDGTVSVLFTPASESSPDRPADLYFPSSDARQAPNSKLETWRQGNQTFSPRFWISLASRMFCEKQVPLSRQIPPSLSPVTREIPRARNSAPHQSLILFISDRIVRSAGGLMLKLGFPTFTIFSKYHLSFLR